LALVLSERGNVKYELKVFNDFLKVPVDRLPKCLEEFGEAVLMAAMANELAHGMDQPSVEFRGMTWNDDGKDELTIKISVEEKT
jgi:hypothetical protein